MPVFASNLVAKNAAVAMSSTQLLQHLVTRIPREIVPYSTHEYHLRIAPGEGLTVTADLFRGAQRYITVDYQNGLYMTTVRPRLWLDTQSLFNGKRIQKKELQRVLDEWFVGRTPQAPDFTFYPWVIACIRVAVGLFVSLEASARVRNQSFMLLEEWVKKRDAKTIEKFGNNEVARLQYLHERVQAIRRWQKLKYSLQLRRYDKIQMPLDLYNPQLHGVFPQFKSLHSLEYEVFLLARTKQMVSTDGSQASIAQDGKSQKFHRQASRS